MILTSSQRRSFRLLLPFLFVFSQGPVASSGQPVFRFEPEGEGRRQVTVESVEHGFRWRLRVPERVFCDEGVLVGHDFQKVHTPVDWQVTPEGGLSYKRHNQDDTGGRRVGEIAYAVDIMPAPYGASLKISFTNTGDKTIHNLTGHICLSHLSETFRDPEYKRSFMRVHDAFLNLNETARGANPIRTHYRVDGHRPIKLFDNTTNRFWGGLAPEVADSGLILTQSTDKRFLVALWFDPAAELFHNCDDRNMCIHSDPTYGDLAPGASVTVEGRLILFEGDLPEFEEKFLK